jgi:hypothetical protein
VSFHRRSISHCLDALGAAGRRRACETRSSNLGPHVVPPDGGEYQRPCTHNTQPRSKGASACLRVAPRSRRERQFERTFFCAHADAGVVATSDPGFNVELHGTRGRATFKAGSRVLGSHSGHAGAKIALQGMEFTFESCARAPP